MGGTGRRGFLAGMAGTALAAPRLARAQGDDPIRIGEVNSHETHPLFLAPYRRGWELAQARVNEAGGVRGRRLTTLFRDDGGRPDGAAAQARALVQEGVALLAGGLLSPAGLALSEAAEQSRRVYLATGPLTDALAWSRGSRFTFQLRPNTHMQASMLVEEAAKLPATRWATIAPNYEYGQSAVRHFRELLRRARPEVQFVSGAYTPLGGLDAAAVGTLVASGAEAVFNATFGQDLLTLARSSRTLGLSEGRSILSLLTGTPENLGMLGELTPEGWIVTGSPAELRNPGHDAFRAAYRDRWGMEPGHASVVGHDALTAIAAALERAEGTETEALIAAFAGLRYETGFGTGPVEFRALDHQSTLGSFVGRTTRRDGQGMMVDWRYAPGTDHLPPDAVVRGLRPYG